MAPPAPHRLALSKVEYACLVDAVDGLSMPVGWEPGLHAESGVATAALARRGVLDGSGDLVTVHPSVATNLRLLAAPQVMLDTTVTIGFRGSHSLHAVSGPLGASLFDLGEGGIELSLFAAVDLGRELVRAVPPQQASRIDTLLSDDSVAEPVRGRLPLEVLEQLGTAALMDSTVDALAGTDLPAEQAELARRALSRTDGTLRCVMTGLTSHGVRTSQVAWLHLDSGWTGLRPDPDGSGLSMVSLEPVEREDLGMWAAPFVAEVLP